MALTVDLVVILQGVQMALIDFKEIPEAEKPTGKQDAFELFARDVLRILGFTILQHPSRGADCGKDLIAEENRIGVLASTKVKWLVSCKHYAFSGRSVTPSDERNVLERVHAASCNGFLGFYSTIPSTGLAELLGRLTSIEVRFLDREQIEGHLLESSKGQKLIERYFPISAATRRRGPAKLYSDIEPIECENCGTDLLEPPSGIWVIWHRKRNGPDHYVDLHFACKGNCDARIEKKVRARHSREGFIYDGWDDIPDFLIPTVYIKKVMAILNGFARGESYETEPFQKLKRILLATYPYVARDLTPMLKKEMKRLQTIPSWLGGMGYED